MKILTQQTPQNSVFQKTIATVFFYGLLLLCLCVLSLLSQIEISGVFNFPNLVGRQWRSFKSCPYADHSMIWTFLLRFLCWIWTFPWNSQILHTQSQTNYLLFKPAEAFVLPNCGHHKPPNCSSIGCLTFLSTLSTIPPTLTKKKVYLLNVSKSASLHCQSVAPAFKRMLYARCWWFMPVILTTQEEEIGRIMVWSQPRQTVVRPYLKINQHKKGWNNCENLSQN
jgi:hypothetical protein